MIQDVAFYLKDTYSTSKKFIYLSSGIFCGIRYNPFLNYIMGFNEQFHIPKLLSVVIDSNIVRIS
jgi:hypothetical protein